MISLISLPKPFKGHLDVIQRNAIESWLALSPRPEIILFGDEEGVAEVCKEYSIRQVPVIRRSKGVVPFLYFICAKGAELASFDKLCFINADILLFDDFIETLKRLESSSVNEFLMTGNRWNVDQVDRIDFASSDRDALKQRFLSTGKYLAPAFDYFIFKKELFAQIPPFLVGRFAWDIWMQYAAVNRNAYLIDASRNISCIHQNHDYSMPTDMPDSAYKRGLEREYNRKLCGNTLLRLYIPAYRLERETLKIDIKSTFMNEIYTLRRNLMWRVWNIVNRIRYGSDFSQVV